MAFSIPSLPQLQSVANLAGIQLPNIASSLPANIAGPIMKLIGGAPLMKSVRTLAEKLVVARHIAMPKIPELQGILDQVLKNGPAALLQNPMGALQGQLQSALSGSVGQLAQLGDVANGLSLTLNETLGGSLSALNDLQGALSGVASGPLGLLDVVAHGDLADMLGSALPEALSMSNVLKPLDMANQLNGVLNSVNSITQSVVSGALSVDAAIFQVQAIASDIDQVVEKATTAIALGQMVGPSIANAQAAMGSMINASGAMQSVMTSIVKPEFHGAILSALDD